MRDCMPSVEVRGNDICANINFCSLRYMTDYILAETCPAGTNVFLNHNTRIRRNNSSEDTVFHNTSLFVSVKKIK